MIAPRRRTLLAGIASLAAGCSSTRSSSGAGQTDDPTPGQTPTEPPDSVDAGLETNTPPESGEWDITTPQVTLEYGEPYRERGLTISVEQPTIQSEFYVDDPLTPPETPSPPANNAVVNAQAVTETDARGVHEMPEGEALAFLDLTFENEHPDASRGVSPASFYVDTEAGVFEETRSIDHPELGQISRSDIDDLRRDFRWSPDGGFVEPRGRREVTALFVVPDDVDETAVTVVHDMDTGTFADNYDTATVAWTRGG